MRKSNTSLIDGHDISALEHVVLAAVNQTADLLRGGFYSELEIKTKSHTHDLVTQFDTQAEDLIISTIKKEYPDHAFVGEESGCVGDTENKITWIIDPIDGTWNFAKQIPSFAISVAACYKGEAYLGVCLDPIANELYIGRRGEGATMNGKKLSVSTTNKLKDAGISLGKAVGVEAIHKIALIRRTGSTVLDLCYVAKGALEGLIDDSLNVWDYAAAALIVQEAGGVVSTFENKPLPYDIKVPSSIVASNNEIHKELVKWISMANK